MNRLIICLLCILSVALISACSQQVDDSIDIKYQEIGWEELMPEDEATGELRAINQYGQETDSGMEGFVLQIYSSKVVAELDGKNIRLPGFIVPIEFEAENLITEFFLVPYFGACYHKPPPPPNQTIYVKSDKAIRFESIYDPVWLMGLIETKQAGNDIATAAYSMTFHSLEPYFN